MNFLLASVLAYTGVVLASPVAAPGSAASALQAIECSVENLLLSKATTVPTARSSLLAFCSSFISLPPVTKIVTNTLTTTVTTVVPLATVTETTSTALALDKRAATTFPVPSVLASLVSSQISQACSCVKSQITLATSTTTTTSTIKETATASTSTIIVVPTETCTANVITNGGFESFDSASNTATNWTGSYALSANGLSGEAASMFSTGCGSPYCGGGGSSGSISQSFSGSSICTDRSYTLSFSYYVPSAVDGNGQGGYFDLELSQYSAPQCDGCYDYYDLAQEEYWVTDTGGVWTTVSLPGLTFNQQTTVTLGFSWGVTWYMTWGQYLYLDNVTLTPQ